MSKNTPHTVGPWDSHIGDDYVAVLKPEKTKSDRIICKIQYPAAEDYANARLIAAAPDLLTALETIALHAPSLDAVGIRELCDAATKKVKGEKS